MDRPTTGSPTERASVTASSMDVDGDDAQEIRTRVLQNTLDEVALRPSTSEAPPPECCVICLGDVSEPCESRPCGHHNFDYLCLVTWLEQRPTCPLCKTAVAEVRYEFGPDRSEWKTYELPKKHENAAEAGSQTPRVPISAVHRRLFGQQHLRAPRGRRARPSPSSSDQERWEEPSESEAVRRRRLVYRHRTYSLHVGSNRRQPEGARYRELSPQLFMADPALVSRARMWIRRELQVFEFLSLDSTAGSGAGNAGGDPTSADGDVALRRRRVSNAEFFLEYIVAILKTVDIQASGGQAEDMIGEFLGREDARLFLHELRAWLRSPCGSLSAWDRLVQYGDRSRLVQDEAREDVDDGAEGASIYPDHYSPVYTHGRHGRDKRRRFEPYRLRWDTDADRIRDASRRYTPD